MAITKISTNGEVYSTFEKSKGDALIKKLDESLNSTGDYFELEESEKMIFFEILRAQIQLSFPGYTMTYADFTRNLLIGEIKWGNKTIKMKTANK